MKKTIFRPGFFSLFMIALMIYLSCNKQNNTEVIHRQNIIAIGENESLIGLKWLNQPVILSKNNPENYIGPIRIKNQQDKDIVTHMRSGYAEITFQAFDYKIFTSIILRLN